MPEPSPVPTALHVTVVVPALDAARTLRGVLEGIPRWVRTVVVISDGSRDAPEHEEAGRAGPHVILEVHAHRLRMARRSARRCAPSERSRSTGGWPATNGGATTLLAQAVLAVLVGVVWYVRLATPPVRPSMRTFDLRTYFLPTYAAFYGWLARGVLLLWNPYQLCGLPWIGTLEAGFFYPPHVLYLVLPPHRALFYASLFHVLLAALSTAALARRLGLPWAAATAAALAFALRGQFARWLGWPYMLEASAWLPLGCLAVHGLVQEGGRRWAALLGVTLGMSWLAGGPQATTFLVYGWASLLLVLLVTTPPRRCIRAGVTFSVALGLGTLAAMIQLLPARELAGVGARAAAPLDTRSMFSFGLTGASVWTLAMPGGMAGFTLLGWALASFSLAARRHRPVVGWCLVLGGLTLLFAGGPRYPTFALYRVLPLLAWFHDPQRILLLSGFAFALLVGIGADVLLGWVRAGESRLRAGRAPVLSHALGALVVALSTLGIEPWPGQLPYGAEQAREYHRQDAAYATLAGLQGDARIWFAANFVVRGFPPRLATVHGVRSFQDVEPLYLARQRDYLTFLFGGRGSPLDWIRVDTKELVSRARLLDLASVRYVVVPYGGLADALQSIGMQPRAIEAPGVRLLENPHAVPRAYVTYRTRPTPAQSPLVLPELVRPDFDPLEASYVEGAAPLPDDATAPHGHPVTIVIDQPHAVEIEADCSAPGLIVLTDTFAPGWEATVDGSPAPVLATNHLFRGVPVSAGRHRIRFAYRSRAVPAGAMLSLVAWCLLGVLGRGRWSPDWRLRERKGA